MIAMARLLRAEHGDSQNRGEPFRVADLAEQVALLVDLDLQGLRPPVLSGAWAGGTHRGQAEDYYEDQR